MNNLIEFTVQQKMAVLNYAQTQELLEKYGVPHAKSFASESVDALVQASYSFEFPLVLKGMSAQVLHKTEKKMIFLNIQDERELRGAAATLSARASDQGIKLGHFLLQEQKTGVEFIIGGKRDPSFGPVLMFGFGGIYAELLKDFAVRVCPAGESEILEMMRGTKAGLFFSKEGFRGMNARESVVAEILSATNKLLLENPQIIELDFNPVIAGTSSASVVDARIIVD